MQFLYQKFVHSLSINNEKVSDDQVHLFNEKELAQLKKIYLQTLTLTAFTGGTCIVSYYIPTYIFEDLFLYKIPLNIFVFIIPIGVAELIWCGVMTFIEIVLLTLIHLRMTHRISVISGMLRNENKKEVLKDVLKMGTGTKDMTIVNYGLNPIKDVSKLYLVAINALNIFKAFLSNQLLRLILRQFIARYLFKYFLDLIGTPIYMFFNALGSHFVYRNIISTIMGKQVISLYSRKLIYLELKEDEKELIYDALHLIVISKKAFNYNHAALTREIMDFYKISPVKDRIFKEDNLLKQELFRPEVQKLVNDIVVLGFVLDGKISYNVKQKIENINNRYRLNLSVNQLIKSSEEFIKGKGVELVGIK
jgi:hypothetical protein